MSDLDDGLADLHKWIKAHGISAAPHMHNKDVYKITRSVGFEPNGRASETWEYTWYLELPWCYHHWDHLRDGWTKGNNDHAMSFHASSLRMVIAFAVNFLREAYNQGLRLGDNIREEA